MAQMKIHHAQLQDATNRAASLQVDGVWQMAPATTDGQERASTNHTADLIRWTRWGDQEQGSTTQGTALMEDCQTVRFRVMD